MKYSVVVKFTAIILCACSLVAAAFSGLGIAFMEGYDLYQTPLETVQRKEIDAIANQIAWEHAQRYALETLSNAPQELVDRIYGSSYYSENLYGQYAVEIRENGRVVSQSGVEQQTDFGYAVALQPTYPVVTSYTMEWEEIYGETQPEHAPEEEPRAAVEENADLALARVADQEVLYSEELSTGYNYDSKTDRHYETIYSINYYQAPEYEVQVWLAEDVLMGPDYMLITALYPYRDYFIPVALAALAAFAVSFVFLCTVAGRTKNGEVKLAAINRIPLDLYGIFMAGLAVLLFMPLVWLFEEASYYTDGSRTIWDNPYLCLLICCLCGLGMALCIIGFLYAFAAQVKASDNYWLRHTFIGWCLRQLGKVLGWVGKGFAAVGKAFQTAGRGIRAVFLMLPVIWQWIVTAAGMALVVGLSAILCAVSMGMGSVFWGSVCTISVLGCIGIVCYGGWCFGTLLKGIQTMSSGDLNYKINTRFLYGSFREFGKQLNSLAEAAKLAAENQMKSERMRTELITNVSHDIKTPLTSIINFVDLMKKPHTEAEGEEYLAVLDRQSQRLKKLIDDLMDMSKASSGNMSVELSKIDASEAVNQALGEFADKLEKARLTPVFRHPEEQVLLRADGKHLWRILSNILNNAVKYALPDTRLYIDLMVLQGNAVIAVKNISREQLNVNAEELMERFVRGDASRNTEGSGLGLNIAKSLAELQNGQMHLMVDGDLFKVTLIFPLA